MICSRRTRRTSKRCTTCLIQRYAFVAVLPSTTLMVAKEPKLWYGIGILYDRYGSLEHAEEAFSQVMRMEPGFEKANEIYFRLGIIYKQQQKFNQSLDVSNSLFMPRGDVLTLPSASSTLSPTRHDHSLKRTFGSKLVTYMSSRKRYVRPVRQNYIHTDPVVV